MDPRLQRRIQRYGWDRAADTYEASWAAQLKPAQDRLLELAGLQSGERVLDVACGTGLVTFKAADLVGPQGRVLAVDISDRMVERVLDEAQERMAGQVSARRLAAEKLEGVPDTSVDAVLCALGLMYVTSVEDALAEMRRVLEPGGRLVAAVWGARKGCGWAGIFPIVESRVQTDVCPMFFQLGTGPSLQLALERAGFADVVADRISTTLEYATGEQAADAAFAGGPVAMAYSRFDDETRRSARADYIASIEPYWSGGAYQIPGEFVIAAGRRPPAGD